MGIRMQILPETMMTKNLLVVIHFYLEEVQHHG